MSQQVTIRVSEEVVRHAALVAADRHEPIEDILAEWLESVVADRPVEELSDEDALALTELRLNKRQEETLADLLERNRECGLDAAGRHQLDELIGLYEQGLLRKSQALRVAVRRGLREPLEA